MKKQNILQLKKFGFTLAEVLITLGVIGIVAALTLPSVVANYQKQKTVSFVKKFYNEINNAIKLSVAENGDVDLWMQPARNNSYQENLEFVKNYILPYIKYDHYENCEQEKVCIYLPYGLFIYRVDGNGGDITFFVNRKIEYQPKNYFAFQFNKKNTDQNLDGKGIVEPYSFAWDGNYLSLKNAVWGGCNENATDARLAYCTKWIQMNNWEIPKDYPWKRIN